MRTRARDVGNAWAEGSQIRKRSAPWRLLWLLLLFALVVACSRSDSVEPPAKLATASAALTQGSDAGPPPAPPEPNWQNAIASKMLPTQEVGALPGSGSVGADGAYTYHIPIHVPPGRMDMAPRLELTYSSRGGDGPLGVGWSISGLSSITRCRRTLAHEEQAEGVLFDATDRFCLDGQKLEGLSGTYGADGAEYATERYSASRVRSFGQGPNAGEPAWFEVRTRDGRILDYGTSSPNSRLEALRYQAWDNPETTSTRSIFGWLLRSERDRWGNSILYSYSRDFEGGPDADLNAQRKISQISYTANNGAGLAAKRAVRFVYQTRTDPATASFRNYPIRTRGVSTTSTSRRA